MRLHRLVPAVLLIVVCPFGPTANAQTRLQVEAGPLIPLGDLADSHETALYLGARWEMQDVNALGQVALLSYFLRGGYGVLRLDSQVEAALETAGQSTSTSLVELGAGVRAYSTELPLFVTVGGGYGNFDGAGNADSEHGLHVMLGVGISQDFEAFFIEIEARGNLMVVDPENLQYFTLTGGLGLPF